MQPNISSCVFWPSSELRTLFAQPELMPTLLQHWRRTISRSPWFVFWVSSFVVCLRDGTGPEPVLKVKLIGRLVTYYAY